MNKKTTLGAVLTAVGVAVLVCTLVFAFFGHRLFLKPGLEFEPEQVSYETPDTITIPGFDNWTIPANETLVKCDFYNPDGNSCYFEISIRLDDTGTEIYHSKLLRPGQHLYDIELLSPVPAGSYDAVIHYSTFAIEDNSPMNGADVPFRLIAE